MIWILSAVAILKFRGKAGLDIMQQNVYCEP